MHKHIFALANIISSYMSSPVAYRTQTLGVPKSLKDPHITRVLGIPGPHISSNMPPVPIYGDWDPQIGGSHFTQTPDQFFGDLMKIYFSALFVNTMPVSMVFAVVCAASF